MNTIPKLLSKTKLMRGYRCLKCIYLTVHAPSLEAPITPDTQALFDQGTLVGATARDYYPGGILVDNKPWDFTGALSQTRALLAKETPILYEAAFEYMGCYARADIIQYSPTTKRWRIYEVKSSTKVKPEHLEDVGLQAWIMAKSGLAIESIHIVHLNPECRYPDLEHLFTEVDVTQDIRDQYLGIQPKVRDILLSIRQPDVPDIDIGSYCLSPNECGFKTHCFDEKKLPEMSILDLPGLRERKWALYQQGITHLNDPNLSDLNALQQRIVDCYTSGQRYIDSSMIRDALLQWQFPLTFLDFETINPAIPRYTGTRPFSHTPFQFSIHHWSAPDQDITHSEFLHDTPDDPRPTLIPALLNACGNHGSIVAYYSKFESDRIRELADFAPSHREALEALIERMVDPLPIIKNHVYDNAFHGSFSLKSVAPALLGPDSDYAGMKIANGNDAQRAFEELIHPSIPLKQKEKLKQAMLAYCKKDTQEMLMLVQWLRAQ